MEPARLRPLQVGEILDAAIKVFRGRFTTLVKAVFPVIAPIEIFSVLIELSIPRDAFQTNEFGETTADGGAIAGMFVAIGIVALLGYFATQLATAASLKIVSDSYLGKETTWYESLTFAFKRLKSVAWVGALIFLLMAAGLPFCAVPTVYMWVAFSVAIPVVLLEGIPGTRALHRSKRLVEGRWWSVAGILAVALILTFVVGAVVGGIFSAIAVGAGSETVAVLVDAFSSILVSSVVTPFTAAVVTIVYFDLRVRKEGFDLELLAQSVGQESAGEQPSDRWRLDGE